ncbi:MAG: LPS export ABC transporter permease LptF [Albidovulum sp.]
MSRFDRYMLSQLLTLFGFFALILVAVYWVNRAVILFDQLIADGQSAWVFLEFTALTLPNVIRLVLPMAAFVSAVYVTNRLTSDSELVVMQATGFSPFRLARPVIYFGLVVGLMMAVLVHYLVPSSRVTLAERQSEISQDVTARFLVEGGFVHPVSGLTLYIREISPLGELQDVFLSDSRKPEFKTIYTAERALLVRSNTGPKLVMFDGIAQSLTPASGTLAVTRFGDFSYDIGALIGPATGGRIDVDEMPTPALLWPDPSEVERLNSTPEALIFAGHERISQMFLPLVSALIGFATLLLGGFSRFGLWRQISAATVLLIIVQLLVNAVASAVSQSPELWPAVYAPELAGLALGFGMLFHSGRGRRIRRGGGLAVAS